MDNSINLDLFKSTQDSEAVSDLIYLAEPMKSEVSLKLFNSVKYAEKAELDLLKLQKTGVTIDFRIPGFSDATKEVITSFFENIDRNLTNNHANDTPAEITLNKHKLNENIKTIIEVSWPYRTTEDKDKAITTILKEIPFTEIQKEYQSQINNIENVGMELLANQLFMSLNLKYKCYEPIYKPNYIAVIKKSITSSWCDVRDETQTNELLFKVFENSNISLGNSYPDFITETDKLGYEQALPSRTQFGKNTHLWVVCFNNKTELRFSHEAFNHIVAYISAYGSEDVKNNMYDLMSTLENAA